MSAATSNSAGASLNYVTAIVDSDLEAQVAQLLFSHGNNIIFRALNLNSLSEFLSNQSSGYQIVHCGDFAADASISNLQAKFVDIKFIHFLYLPTKNLYFPLSINNEKRLLKRLLLEDLIRRNQSLA